MAEPAEKLPTFAELAALEPRLLVLLEEARAENRRTRDVTTRLRLWYAPGGLKARLCALVGGLARDAPAALRSWQAYAVAYQTIHDALRWAGR